MSSHIRIEIAGGEKRGKTWLAIILEKMLQDAGLNAHYFGPDQEHEEQYAYRLPLVLDGTYGLNDLRTLLGNFSGIHIVEKAVSGHIMKTPDLTKLRALVAREAERVREEHEEMERLAREARAGAEG